MIWLALIIGGALVVAVALFAVGRVTGELSQTIAPALLEVDDAVEVVAQALPFEVAAVLSHDDVEHVIRWVLDWFDSLGMASEFGEEIGGDMVSAERAVADEVGAAEYTVGRAHDEQPDLDAIHVTVVVDAFLAYLRDLGAVGGEVQ